MTEAAQKETTAQGKVSETGVLVVSFLVIFVALFCAGRLGWDLPRERPFLSRNIEGAPRPPVQGLIERAMGQVPTHLCVAFVVFLLGFSSILCAHLVCGPGISIRFCILAGGEIMGSPTMRNRREISAKADDSQPAPSGNGAGADASLRCFTILHFGGGQIYVMGSPKMQNRREISAKADDSHPTPPRRCWRR
jgi:hypothetical protein